MTLDALHTAAGCAKDVNLTIRLAGEAGQATVIDDDKGERLGPMYHEGPDEMKLPRRLLQGAQQSKAWIGVDSRFSRAVERLTKMSSGSFLALR